jgi:hypothetical protein
MWPVHLSVRPAPFFSGFEIRGQTKVFENILQILEGEILPGLAGSQISPILLDGPGAALGEDSGNTPGHLRLQRLIHIL